MLTKIGSAELNGLLIKSAAAIRDLSAENEQLRAQLAKKDRREHAVKIASVAVERGIVAEDAQAEYAQTLASGSRNLDDVEELVSHAAAGLPLGELTKEAADGDGASGVVPGAAEQKFASFLTNSGIVH